MKTYTSKNQTDKTNIYCIYLFPPTTPHAVCIYRGLKIHWANYLQSCMSPRLFLLLLRCEAAYLTLATTHTDIN